MGSTPARFKMAYLGVGGHRLAALVFADVLLHRIARATSSEVPLV